MGKRIKKLYIFLLILVLFTPKVVGAVSCNYVTNVINEYYDIRDELEQMDCENTTEPGEASECNAKNTRKALLLGKIFKYNDEVKDCNNAEIAKIVEENKDECKNLFGTSLTDIRKTVMNFFYILAPFLLLIFGSLDFFKIVVEHDPKAMAEQRKKFIKRLIAFVLLFFTPVFINMILNWNLSNYSLNGNVYTCKTPYAFSIKTWNSTYIPPVTPSSSGGGSSSNNGDSDLGLSTNNGLFAIRETSPMASGGNQYYDTSESNAYECVWYAKSRAIEALSTSSDSEKDTKISKIKSSYGHGWMWFHLAVPGEQTAIGNSESLGSLDSLVGFKYSSDANKPRAGSLVSWRWSSYGCSTYWSKRGRGNSCSDSNPEYGHVGFVEDVDTSNNKVMISEGWNNGGSLGFACNWYTFDEMESKGGRYDFQGYVYLFDSLDK